MIPTALSTSSFVIINGGDILTVEPDIAGIINNPSPRHPSLNIPIGRSSTGASGYKSGTGSSETPSVTHTNVNCQALIGFVVQADWGE